MHSFVAFFVFISFYVSYRHELTPVFLDNLEQITKEKNVMGFIFRVENKYKIVVVIGAICDEYGMKIIVA